MLHESTCAHTFTLRESTGLISQLAEHYKLYTGYVNKTNEIWSLLPEANRREANATYSPYRELKLEETFAFNGVKLHELYFTNLGGLGGPPFGPIADVINHGFGSIEQWAEDFRALALSARGWGALVYDHRTNRLHNFLYDAHNMGGSAETHILLIIVSMNTPILLIMPLIEGPILTLSSVISTGMRSTGAGTCGVKALDRTTGHEKPLLRAFQSFGQTRPGTAQRSVRRPVNCSRWQGLNFFNQRSGIVLKL